MIHRDFTAEKINALVNAPEIRPDIADMASGKLDLSPIVANTNNVVMTGEYGGVVLFYIMDGFYEVHSAFLPEGRGKWAMEFLRSGMRLMFTCTNAYNIATRVPEEHLGAKQAALMCGMRKEFSSECVFRERLMSCDIYSIDLATWAAQVDGMIERGQWLHQRLKQEAARLGITAPTHEDIEAHNRYAGICYEMCRQGQAKKAVQFYNRWAFLARHRLISLQSLDPPVIKFDIGMMRLKEDGDIEVVPSC
jgi:hypothetical protein